MSNASEFFRKFFLDEEFQEIVMNAIENTPDSNEKYMSISNIAKQHGFDISPEEVEKGYCYLMSDDMLDNVAGGRMSEGFINVAPIDPEVGDLGDLTNGDSITIVGGFAGGFFIIDKESGKVLRYIPPYKESL